MRWYEKSYGRLVRILRVSLCTVLVWTVMAPRGAQAQQHPRYLVLFTDKSASPFSLQQPEAFLSLRALERRTRQGIPLSEADLPVNPRYMEGVSATGAYVLFSTRWFNGVVVSASDEQLEAIRSLPYFRAIERDMPLTGSNYRTARRGVSLGENLEDVEKIDYGVSLTQLEMMGVPALHGRGYTGEGVWIGVMDSGFTNADQQGYLAHLYAGNQVVDTFDFIDGDTNVYNDHSHGLNVLSTMASKWDGRLIGAAFGASYALYRTENTFSETPYEEVAWLLAAERADSAGVDIINTSLGYTTFDNPALNYTYADMDGRTAIISKAARFAARTGMLVVVSAGNEGASSWKYISAPADVDSVLSVGAVSASFSKAPFSSVGPNAEEALKPDVAAMGLLVRVGMTDGSAGVSQGTSFSAPLVAGLAALLWQMYPEKSAAEMIRYLKSMGHQASSPDSLLGYGVPYFSESGFQAPSDLRATVIGNTVNLSWKPLQEDVSVYELERSHNGSSFTRIAELTASHADDWLADPGNYGYRVRAVGEDFITAYSGIARVEMLVTGTESERPVILLYPNPANSALFLSFPVSAGREVKVSVVSATGQKVSPEYTFADGRGEVPLTLLSPGLYFLRIRKEDGSLYTARFVKH